MKLSLNNSWVLNPLFDLCFILSIPFICATLVLTNQNFWFSSQNNNEWLWLILVLIIDVGHVYSTLFRTYLDPHNMNTHRSFLIYAPILLFFLMAILYSISAMLFWRILAYTAVFHFIKQQYGFMRIYSRKELNTTFLNIDKLLLYTITLYPIINWHLSGLKKFNWFVVNDFVYLSNNWLIQPLEYLYIIIILLYIYIEIRNSIKTKTLNIAKNFLLLGTGISWYWGIVKFNNDLVFTLFNTASHGIPYFALVWANGFKKWRNEQNKYPNVSAFSFNFFSPKWIFAFLLFLFSLAYIEEYLWDNLLWREHSILFPYTSLLPDLSAIDYSHPIIIPLLTLPQVMHYFIDGFIWKIKNDQFNWLKYLN